MSMQPPNEPGWQGPPNHPQQPPFYNQPTEAYQQPQGAQQPGQFQQPPQQSLPHTRFMAWLRRPSRSRILVLGFLLPFCIIMCCVTAGISALSGSQHNSQTAVQATPTDTPTSAPALIATDTPTDTPVPTSQPTAKPTDATGNLTATYGTPRLGGPISDFIGKYGKPNDHTDTNSFHWFRDSSSNADGLIVWELTHPNQVDSIDVQSVNGDMPNMSAAVALCTVYNPSDAHQLKRIPLVSASGQASGVDVVYLSASLAHVFTPDDFTDSQQNNVQPGTFDIQYLYKGDGTQNMDSCSILPGEQQTQG